MSARRPSNFHKLVRNMRKSDEIESRLAAADRLAEVSSKCLEMLPLIGWTMTSEDVHALEDELTEALADYEAVRKED